MRAAIQGLGTGDSDDENADLVPAGGRGSDVGLFDGAFHSGKNQPNIIETNYVKSRFRKCHHSSGILEKYARSKILALVFEKQEKNKETMSGKSTETCNTIEPKSSKAFVSLFRNSPF